MDFRAEYDAIRGKNNEIALASIINNVPVIHG
jgi:hypothetical protein